MALIQVLDLLFENQVLGWQHFHNVTVNNSSTMKTRLGTWIHRAGRVPLSVVHPYLHGAVSLPNTKQLRDSKQKWPGNYAM